MKNYTSKEIIKGCKQEDPQFQKALVLQYSKFLMGVSKRYTRDPASAKDLVQETLIKILRGLPKYKEQGNFEAWMKRILINIALKQMQKNSFSNELYNIKEIPIQAIMPDVYANMAVDELIKVINRLPESYRSVFNLYAIEGFSHKEISIMMGIKESSSRSKLTRARALLKTYLHHQKKTMLGYERSI